jgi:hypothetical protein
LVVIPRRFPPPWSVEDPDPKLDRPCFIVRDHDGQDIAMDATGFKLTRVRVLLAKPTKYPAET